MNQCGRDRLSSCWRLGILCLVAMMGTAPYAIAQNSQSSCVVTTRGGSEVLDVVFLLECSNAESVGALHFDVQVVGGASTSDRELEIALSFSPYADGRVATVHRQTIRLKEGAVSARGLLPFSMTSSTDATQQRLHFWNVAVYEDQRDIERTRAIQANPGAQYAPVRLNPGERPPYMVHQRGTQSGAVLHVLDSGATFDAELAYRITSQIIKNNGSQPSQETPAFDLARDFLRAVHVRHIESMPEYWHYYLQFNAVTIGDQTLARLRTERSLAAEALKQYVAAGGDLIFISSKKDGPRLIDGWLFNSDDTHNPLDWATDLRAFRPAPPPVRITPDALTAEMAAVAETAPIEIALAENQNADDTTKTEGDAAEQPSASGVVYKRWATRSHARGRILCMENEIQNSFPASVAYTGRATPVGVAISSIHDEGWSLRNMIASVGKPPVWTFCGIVLLFGLILGPGLLILTGWIGRRSLLILLVPLVSIGATLAIVAYEVFHEGFGTHSRICSVLSVDERTGEGFVWSRQNYFSGWPPREGITVPNEVYCRPVGASRMGRSGAPRTASAYQYSVDHKSEGSTWNGVLQAREQKQFLIGHPAKLPMPIQVKRIDDKRASLRNLTDETLPFVVLRDGKNGYYFVENLAPGAEVEVASGPFGDIAGSLSRMRTELAPTLPAELRSMGWGVAQEQNGAEILDQDWLGSMAEQTAQSTIKPYGFVTLIRNCGEVYVPLKADKSESLHLVTGSALW